MVAWESDDGKVIDLPDELVRAVARQASLQADLVNESLLAMGFCPSNEHCFPGALLLELGAVTTLKLWELQGVADHLPDFVPSFEQARNDFVTRCNRGKDAFSDFRDTPFSHLVLRMFIDYFAWEGGDCLQASMIVGPVNEDEFADCIASFLWTHRHELEQLLYEESNDKEKT
ncbi:hypothetical protein GC197_06675 [bacterium]|nr:hypothetical protein [bacterium]